MRNRSRVLIAAALAVTAGFALWAQGRTGDGPKRPNVILISIDTLRADHLGSYGYPKPTSPFLDRLAAEGVRFSNAFAQTSWTLPSHMSLMTSRYPHNHGVETFDTALAETVTSLPQILQRHGYQTAGFVTNLYVSRRYGFHRGFDHFVELLPDPNDPSAQSVRAAEVVDAVLTWTDWSPSRPWFLFVHLFDPHLDYAPPLQTAQLFDPDAKDVSIGKYEFLDRYMKGMSEKSERIPADLLPRVVALYDGEIRYTDGELERLFGALGRRKMLDDTLVIVTSDHGEELDDHGSMEGHQWTLYDEAIHVPLIARFPGGARAGTTVDSLVESIDVAPMILSVAGVPVPPEFEGRDPFGTDAEAAPKTATFSEIKRFTHKWAIRTDRQKLVLTADTGLNPFGIPTERKLERYDLVNDPREQHNIAAADLTESQHLLDRLARWESGSQPPPSVPAAELSPADIEQLRALGYLNR